MEGEAEETKFIPREDLQALLSDEGWFRLYPFFPYDESRRFEMLSIEMEPGFRSESAPHEEGTEEYVLVFEGTMKLTVDGNKYLIHGRERSDFL